MPYDLEPHIEYESREEWLDKGRELYGDDYYQWKFRCPACGNIARIEDYKEFKDKGASPDSAATECLGRYKRGRKGPLKCDWAAYGFFSGPSYIKFDDEPRKAAVFNFAGIGLNWRNPPS